MPGYGFMGGIQNYPGGGGYGADLKQMYRSYYGATVGFSGRGEMVPNDDTYCEIDDDVVDRWGIPVLKFHFRWSDHEIRQARHMQETFREIIDAMVDSVHSKAGIAFRISRGMNYKMAGKTGTAQVFGIPQGEEYDAEKLEKKLRDHALFVAFAPLERPRIAVAVVVENGGSGGSTAAPIARKVVDHFLGEPDSNAQNATANLTQDLTN